MSEQLGRLFGTLAPRLDGARCVGRHEWFDLAEPDTDPAEAKYHQLKALRLCSGCPALAACSSWFDSLKPAQRPLGVIAGRVNRPAKRKGAA